MSSSPPRAPPRTDHHNFVVDISKSIVDTAHHESEMEDEVADCEQPDFVRLKLKEQQSNDYQDWLTDRDDLIASKDKLSLGIDDILNSGDFDVVNSKIATLGLGSQATGPVAARDELASSLVHTLEVTPGLMKTVSELMAKKGLGLPMTAPTQQPVVDEFFEKAFESETLIKHLLWAKVVAVLKEDGVDEEDLRRPPIRPLSKRAADFQVRNQCTAWLDAMRVFGLEVEIAGSSCAQLALLMLCRTLHAARAITYIDLFQLVRCMSFSCPTEFPLTLAFVERTLENMLVTASGSHEDVLCFARGLELLTRMLPGEVPALRQLLRAGDAWLARSETAEAVGLANGLKLHLNGEEATLADCVVAKVESGLKVNEGVLVSSSQRLLFVDSHAATIFRSDCLMLVRTLAPQPGLTLVARHQLKDNSSVSESIEVGNNLLARDWIGENFSDLFDEMIEREDEQFKADLMEIEPDVGVNRYYES